MTKFRKKQTNFREKRGRTPRDRSRSEMAEESSSIKTADGGSVILEEDIDENYEPTAAEIEEYSQWLGMTSPKMTCLSGGCARGTQGAAARTLEAVQDGRRRGLLL